ncbi:hypothetical protein SKAU_G00058360 [Synaphobranchus kaupii]|uniref:Uncharacterized protein n=1 Tax=Synaphobranchus kaupii TaxID=118154 RepID=A0A9Q1J9C5_SYNKA|nr:hypothetical protein SKAU_G00058360 [Synaphobranchus kaupii]
MLWAPLPPSPRTLRAGELIITIRMFPFQISTPSLIGGTSEEGPSVMSVEMWDMCSRGAPLANSSGKERWNWPPISEQLGSAHLTRRDPSSEVVRWAQVSTSEWQGLG